MLAEPGTVPEAELQDWYDGEHVPPRSALAPGTIAAVVALTGPHGLHLSVHVAGSGITEHGATSRPSTAR